MKAEMESQIPYPFEINKDAILQITPDKKLYIYRKYIADDVHDFKWLADAVKEKLARQPDLVTGLVNCGCGGKAKLVNISGYGSKYLVTCPDCELMMGADADGGYSVVGIYHDPETAKRDWNISMGYRYE